MTADPDLDARGLRCPLPVIRLMTHNGKGGKAIRRGFVAVRLFITAATP